LALAGAAVGFLPFNLGRAKAFLGDTGSYGIGAAVFALAVWLFVQGVPIVVIIAPMIFVFFDVGFTLVMRLFRGENILLPHREHIYQRIQQTGWPHSSVSLFHAALSVLACIMTVPTLISGNTATTYPAHVFWVGWLALYVLLPRWLGRRAQKEATTACESFCSAITTIPRSVPRSGGGGSSSTTCARPDTTSSPSHRTLLTRIPTGTDSSDRTSDEDVVESTCASAEPGTPAS